MEGREARFNAAKVSVRFITNNGRHTRGERVGFPYSEAMKLVNAGAAVYLVPPPGVDEFGLTDPEPESDENGPLSAS